MARPWKARVFVGCKFSDRYDGEESTRSFPSDPIDTVGCLQGLSAACGQAVLTAQDPAGTACRPATSPGRRFLERQSVRMLPLGSQAPCRKIVDRYPLGNPDNLIVEPRLCLHGVPPSTARRVVLLKQNLKETSSIVMADREVEDHSQCWFRTQIGLLCSLDIRVVGIVDSLI